MTKTKNNDLPNKETMLDSLETAYHEIKKSGTNFRGKNVWYKELIVIKQAIKFIQEKTK